MSEFGKGFAYCLGLFLAHARTDTENRQGNRYASLWFNAAADHLFELIIPDIFPKKKRKEITDFQERCLEFRLSDCTWKDVDREIQNAKDFLRQYDELNGVESAKGNYE